jgi:hypothetical protein
MSSIGCERRSPGQPHHALPTRPGTLSSHAPRVSSCLNQGPPESACRLVLLCGSSVKAITKVCVSCAQNRAWLAGAWHMTVLLACSYNTESGAHLAPLLGVAAGWFCGAAPLTSKLRLRVKDTKGGADWREVELPRSVRALVLLNLQSYGGGRDLWGLSDNRLMAEKGFKEPIFDDGLIEVRPRLSLLAQIWVPELNRVVQLAHGI